MVHLCYMSYFDPFIFLELSLILQSYFFKSFNISYDPPQPPLLLAAEDKPKKDIPAVCLPSTSEQWAQYDCPKEVRLAIRFDTSMHSVNRESISKQVSQLDAVFLLTCVFRELKTLKCDQILSVLLFCLVIRPKPCTFWICWQRNCILQL